VSAAAHLKAALERHGFVWGKDCWRDERGYLRLTAEVTAHLRACIPPKEWGYWEAEGLLGNGSIPVERPVVVAGALDGLEDVVAADPGMASFLSAPGTRELLEVEATKKGTNVRGLFDISENSVWSPETVARAMMEFLMDQQTGFPWQVEIRPADCYVFVDDGSEALWMHPGVALGFAREWGAEAVDRVLRKLCAFAPERAEEFKEFLERLEKRINKRKGKRKGKSAAGRGFGK
jgi:hypothetical protein